MDFNKFINSLLKLFGVKYGVKQSDPTPDEAMNKLREAEEMLRKKQNYLETKRNKELVVIENAIDNKSVAKQALRRKNLTDKQLEQINNTLSTIESQRQALESSKTNTQVLEIMKEAAQVLKQTHNNLDIDKIDDIMDELKEQIQISGEITDAISSPIGCDQDLDDQLERLLEGMAQKKLNQLLIDIQPEPSQLPIPQPIPLHNTAIPLPLHETPPEVTAETPNIPQSDNQFIEDNNQTVTEIVLKKDIYKNHEIDCDINEEELYGIYKSFDINFDELNKKCTFLRLNVIHMRGVKSMSSEDVLQYFVEYNPTSIEWVNVLSCNIGFHNEKQSAMAMRGLTKALVLKSNEVKDDFGIDVVDGNSLSVPIPPGFRWRLGLNNNKSKALLMRFATNSDKSYESKHSSDSKKYKSNESLDENQNYDNDNWSGIETGSKREWMRMRADDEVLIEKRRRLPEDWLNQSHQVISRRTVWDRLGTDRLGNHYTVNQYVRQIDNRTNYRQSISAVKSNDLRNKLNKKNQS